MSWSGTQEDENIGIQVILLGIDVRQCEDSRSIDVLGVLKTTPGYDDSLGRLTEFSIQLSSWLCFITGKGYKAKSARGKVRRMKSGGNQAQASKSLLSVEVHRTHNSSSRIVTPCVKCHPSGKFIRDSVLQVFIKGWSYSQLLLSRYQNYRPSEQKQMFGINHIVCTNSLGTVNLSQWLER